MRRMTKGRALWALLALNAALLVSVAVLSSHVARENSDPYSGVPYCTDAIADNGGVCHGEPLPECPTEDSANCYWDASIRGNGQGRSFVDIDGEVHYQIVK
jgi:hypothetical protein